MNVASICVPKERIVAEAHVIAETIARKVLLAVIAAKWSFGLSEKKPLRDGYRYDQTQTAALSGTEDTRDALQAFKGKWTPVSLQVDEQTCVIGRHIYFSLLDRFAEIHKILPRDTCASYADL